MVLTYFDREQRTSGEQRVELVGELTTPLVNMLGDNQVETGLYQSGASYRAMVDCAADAILLLTADGTIQTWNRGAEHIFGYGAAEMIGQSLAVLLGEQFQSLFVSGVRLFLEIGERHLLDHPIEAVGRRKAGGEVPLELAVSVVELEQTPAFVGVLRDIGERKQVERERAALLAAEQEQGRRLRELATLKADFTTMVAHELVGPIAAIRGYADLLRGGKLRVEQHTQAFGVIQQQVELLCHLVADIQTTAYIERDDFAVQPRPVSLATLFAQMVAWGATLPGNHPLTAELADDVLVHADADRIGQVLRNLLSNAAKYSPPAAPITLRAQVQGNHVVIEVEDHGWGIQPNDLRRIWEKFGRGRDQAGNNVPGVGVGLYLSRRIVQAHGHDLSVESTYGVGSVFRFALERLP